MIDGSWEEEAILEDGTRVRLRLVRPEDKPLFRAAFDRLSPQSRYRRFLTAKTELSEADLKYLTEVDQQDHLALGATTHRNGDELGAGVARFTRLPGRPEAAEAAVVVVDDLQGRGLGKLLLARLALAASERGVKLFVCEVLASNDRMRGLLHEIAPGALEKAEGETVTLEIPVESHFPLPSPPKEGTLLRLFRSIAEGRLTLRPPPR